MRYVLGVDGGGTKTHCALYDADTGRLDMLKWGPTNHEGMAGGLDDLPGTLRQMFAALLNRNNICMSDIETGVLGLAGVDTAEQHRVISSILTGLGLRRFILCNDAFLGIKAGSSSGAGICAISGTGCCITGLDHRGNQVQVGGLGAYTGDLGGSSMLVPRAVGLVYGQLFREQPYTELTRAMFRWLDITDKDEFIDLLTTRLNDDYAKTTLDLCRILFATAEEGDRASLALLEESGESYAGGIAGAITQLSFTPDETVEIVFAGSLFTKAECTHAQKTAERILRGRFPVRELLFTTLDVPCAAGAVIWALSEIGLAGSRENVLRLFKGGVWL
jgi:N-acetylglucosamine kinase-like BadF-type ATPase